LAAKVYPNIPVVASVPSFEKPAIIVVIILDRQLCFDIMK
jgi:hypothetical protein